MKENQNIDKLQQLIRLTEDVSQKVESLQARKTKYLMSFMLFNLFSITALFILIKFKLVFTAEKDIVLFLILTMIFITLIGSAFYMILNFKKVNTRLDSERNVMSRLYNMTTEFKRSLGDEMDIVEHAVIDMRLSRIFPSVKIESDFLKIENQVSVQLEIESTLRENSYINHLIEDHDLNFDLIKNTFKYSHSLEEARLKLINHLPPGKVHHNSLKCIHSEEYESDVKKIESLFIKR